MLHASLSAGACCVAALLLTVSLSPASAYGACSASSGARTSALVELYTGSPCEACSQADRWLQDLAGRYPAGAVVPLVFHVRRADYATAGHSSDELWRRERRLLPRQRLALAFAPRVMLQGMEFPGWHGAGSGAAVEQVISAPARAHLRLAIVGRGHRVMRVRLEADIPHDRPGSVYMAALELRPGALTAFEWVGPFGLGRHETALDLVPNASAAASGVAAFVQDGRTGAVLQASILGACAL